MIRGGGVEAGRVGRAGHQRLRAEENPDHSGPLNARTEAPGTAERHRVLRRTQSPERLV